MTPAARIAAAIEVIADIETRHRTVADTLKDWGLSHRFAGSKDRAAIGNLVYDTLRWKLSSAFVAGDAAPRSVVLAMAARHWGYGTKGLVELIAGDPHGPAALTDDEAARIDAAELSDAPSYVRADVPEWTAARLEQTFGAEWVEEGAQLALRPPLDLRANRLKADRAKVLKALDRFGAAETQIAPEGVRIAATERDGRHPNVQVEPGFRKGWFEVQDEGSQVAALLVGAKAGEQVLDLCAGAGGKTLAMAAAMGNKGQILATDSDRSRLAPIFERLKRAGTRNAQVRDAGAGLDDIAGRMDAVLIDAPCTGSGTWRRRPDAKWRLTERALGERVAEQDALLGSAKRFVKPGGRLVYVTCSLFPEENDERVAAFLAASPDFVADKPEAVVARAGLPATLASQVSSGGHGLLLSPRRTATDGFYVAVLIRR